ncbi:uncharacterized protein LOC120337525 [Styela clava]
MNRSHIGPHVPLLQRIFCVLSIIAIPLGLSTLVGGVLIIIFLSGAASAASGAIVIFVGFLICTLTPFISYKIFNLRIKLYEGSPRIVKSYGEFPNDLTYPQRGMNLYSVAEFTDGTQPGGTQTQAGPSRSTYLPAEKEIRLDFEEQSTSFGANMTPQTESEREEKPSQPQMLSFVTTQPKSKSDWKPTKTKPLRPSKQQMVDENSGVYYSTVKDENGGQHFSVSNPDIPPRNVSRLHPQPNMQRDDNTSRTKI